MKTGLAMLAAAMFAYAWCAGPSLARAESVYVKYRGEVDLKSFDCKDITRSSLINRVCYDEANEYMLVSLNGTYYHYCAIDGATVSALLAADSMGRFYKLALRAILIAERTECRSISKRNNKTSTGVHCIPDAAAMTRTGNCGALDMWVVSQTN
jgi:hypothetical protein